MSSDSLRAAIFASVIAAAVPNQSMAANLLQNGDFATGDFTDWTLVTTSNGTLGPSPLPQVTSFDVTGTGAQNAAEFEVAQVVYSDGDQEGGGLSQTVTSTAGNLAISADFAVATGAYANSEGGLFSLYLNGTFENVYDFGDTGANTIERASLNVLVPVAAGPQTIEVIITRPYTNSGGLGYTPIQYVTNISASIEASPIPEPSTWAMMLVGFAGLSYAGYRRRKSLPAAASV